jgi:hypothetical protein
VFVVRAGLELQPVPVQCEFASRAAAAVLRRRGGLRHGVPSGSFHEVVLVVRPGVFQDEDWRGPVPVHSLRRRWPRQAARRRDVCLPDGVCPAWEHCPLRRMPGRDHARWPKRLRTMQQGRRRQMREVHHRLGACGWWRWWFNRNLRVRQQQRRISSIIWGSTTGVPSVQYHWVSY